MFNPFLACLRRFVFELGTRTEETDGRTGKTCNAVCYDGR